MDSDKCIEDPIAIDIGKSGGRPETLACTKHGVVDFEELFVPIGGGPTEVLNGSDFVGHVHANALGRWGQSGHAVTVDAEHIVDDDVAPILAVNWGDVLAPCCLASAFKQSQGAVLLSNHHVEVPVFVQVHQLWSGELSYVDGFPCGAV